MSYQTFGLVFVVVLIVLFIIEGYLILTLLFTSDGIWFGVSYCSSYSESDVSPLVSDISCPLLVIF